jgi:hypothetical protein
MGTLYQDAPAGKISSGKGQAGGVCVCVLWGEGEGWREVSGWGVCEVCGFGGCILATCAHGKDRGCTASHTQIVGW